MFCTSEFLATPISLVFFFHFKPVCLKLEPWYVVQYVVVNKVK